MSDERGRRARDDGNAHDARRSENRGTCACNHVFQAFDNRLYIFDARPNPQITSFDLAQDAVGSPRELDNKLCRLRC